MSSNNRSKNSHYQVGIFVQLAEFAKIAEKIKEKPAPKRYIFIDAKFDPVKEVKICFPEKLP